MLMYDPRTVRVEFDEDVPVVNGILRDIRRVVDGSLYLYTDAETGEIIYAKPYYEKITTVKPTVVSKPKKREWEWFAGCTSVNEVNALYQRYLKFMELDVDLSLTGLWKSKLEEEFGRALTSKMPIQNNTVSEEFDHWIDEEIAYLERSGSQANAVWYLYEQKVHSGQIKPCVEDLKRIQTLLGYKPGWVYFKVKELGL